MSRKTLLLGSAAFHMSPAERSKGRFMRAPDEHPTPAATPSPAPETPPAAETPPVVDTPAVDPFQAAFDAELATPAAPAATPPAVTPAVENPPAPTPETPPAPPPPAAPPTPEAPALPTADEIVRQLTEKLGQPAPPTPTPTPEAPPQAPIYTPENETTIAEYRTNWPDVSKAEELIRKGEYHDLMKFIFTQVNQFTKPLFALQDQVAAIGNNLHTGQLKELVPDYTPLVETEVQSWIDTQPNYLQGAMKHVMQAGTSEEVADLIGRYRAQTGNPPAPAQTPPATPVAPGTPPVPATPPKPVTELSEAAKQAAASLAPVGGDRSQVPAGEDSQDFNSAFARYAADAKV